MNQHVRTTFLSTVQVESDTARMTKGQFQRGKVADDFSDVCFRTNLTDSLKAIVGEILVKGQVGIGCSVFTYTAKRLRGIGKERTKSAIEGSLDSVVENIPKKKMLSPPKSRTVIMSKPVENSPVPKNPNTFFLTENISGSPITSSSGGILKALPASGKKLKYNGMSASPSKLPSVSPKSVSLVNTPPVIIENGAHIKPTAALEPVVMVHPLAHSTPLAPIGEALSPVPEQANREEMKAEAKKEDWEVEAEKEISRKERRKEADSSEPAAEAGKEKKKKKKDSEAEETAAAPAEAASSVARTEVEPAGAPVVAEGGNDDADAEKKRKKKEKKERKEKEEKEAAAAAEAAAAETDVDKGEKKKKKKKKKEDGND